MPELKLAAGQALLSQGDYQGAIVTFTNVLRMNPESEEALSGKGACYLALGELERALLHFDAALKVNPRNVETILSRAWVRVEQGHHDLAQQDFVQAIVLEPRNSLIYAERSKAFSRAGNEAMARTDATRAAAFAVSAEAAASAPSSPEPLTAPSPPALNPGSVPPSAPVAPGVAISSENSLEEKRARLERERLQLERDKLAFEEQRLGAETETQRPEAPRRRGSGRCTAVSASSGRIPKARRGADKTSRRVAAQTKSLGAIAISVGSVACFLGAFTLFRVLTPSATVHEPSEAAVPEAPEKRDWSESGSPSQAEDRVEDLIVKVEIEAKRAKARARRAEREAAAAAEFRQAAKNRLRVNEVSEPEPVAPEEPAESEPGREPRQPTLIPSSPATDPTDEKRFTFLSDRAYVRLLQDDWTGALEDYSAALKIRPDIAVLCNRAYALLQLGRNAEALVDCDKALGLDPDDLTARMNLAQARLNLGQSAIAAKEFSRAIEKHPAASYAYEGRGAAYLQLERYKEAEEDLVLALKLLPAGDPRERHVLGLLANARGEVAGSPKGEEGPPGLAQKIREPPPKRGPEPVFLLSRAEARRLIRDWKRAKPENAEFASAVRRLATAEIPITVLKDFRNSLRSSSHGQSALEILSAQLRLPADATAEAVRRNWSPLLKSFKVVRARFFADGETLLKSKSLVRLNTRPLGKNIEVQPEGLVRLSPLPDELQGHRFTLTVRLYVPEGSEGHSVQVVARRETSSWRVFARGVNWVVETSQGILSTPIVRGWNVLEFTTWSAGGPNRSVRIRANESLLLPEGELDGLLEGIEIRAGSAPIVVGALSLRRTE